MKNLLKKISNKFHIHRYNKPILSKYISFNTRNIIFECKCGKRLNEKVTYPFDISFPIETSINLTNKEFDLVLNGKTLKEARGY